MVAPRTVKAGDRLYDVHGYKAGNVKGYTRLGCWPVDVVEIVGDDPDAPGWHVMARWNGNPPRRYTRSDLHRLRRTPKYED